MVTFLKASYDDDLRVTQFITDDGRILIRSGGSMTWQINNPGNLSSPVNKEGIPNPKKTKNYIGFAKRKQHHFFIFPDYEKGRNEKKASLRRKYNEKNFREMINEYAPASDGNDVDDYVSFLVKQTGFSESTKIKDLNEAGLNKLMDAMERKEGYHADAGTRKETWVTVSHIQMTDGTRPLANEEIVVDIDGKKKTLKSNESGQFPPIVHGDKPITVEHKTPSGNLKEVGTIQPDKGQRFNLISKFTSWFSSSKPEAKPEPKPEAKAAAAPEQKKGLQYTVKPNDSLSKISNRFKVSIDQIKKDNKLKSDLIFPGQVLGINEKSAPVSAHPTSPKTQTLKSQPKAATSVQSKEGKGKPLALVPMEDGVAPWMKYALEEAKKYKGINEVEIEKSINYHQEIKDGIKTIVGDKNAWCAAFVNWCLMKAGYPIENPKETAYVDRTAAKARADGFLRLRGEKTEKKQEYSKVPFIVNPLFKKIDEPVYGAIAIVVKSDGAGHHAGFVYAKTTGDRIILLGGNQGSTINFSPFNKDIQPDTIITKGKKKTTKKGSKDKLLFLIPSLYNNPKGNSPSALAEHKTEELNEAIGIAKSKAKSDKPVSTR